MLLLLTFPSEFNYQPVFLELIPPPPINQQAYVPQITVTSDNQPLKTNMALTVLRVSFRVNCHFTRNLQKQIIL